MTATWILLALIGCATTIVGLVGCFVPVLPGPAIAYAALWLLFAFDCPPSTVQLAVGAGVLVIVTLVDYVLPSFCAKKFNCSRRGVFGCFVGSIVGLFFLPLGLILGPFVGTVAGELIAGKNVSSSFRGGLGALLGFVLCLGLKLVAVGLFAWWYFASLPTTSSNAPVVNVRAEADKRALKLGVAYAFQVLENLPSEPHDIGVDSVVALAHKNPPL